VGAAFAIALRSRQHLAIVIGALLGLGGLAAIVLSSPGLVSTQLGIALSFSASARALLIVAAASLMLLVAFTPAAAERSKLLRWGLGGLAGMTAMAASQSLDTALLVALALAVLQSVINGRRPLARRVRGPAIAVAMLGAGLVLTRIGGPSLLERFGAVGLAAGLVGVAGALPYMHEFDPEEDFVAGPLPWTAFIAPVLVLAIVERSSVLLPSAAPAFAAMLIGIGLLNAVWGSLASWRTENDAAAWRYSFTADWGLALSGLGLMVVEAEQAAFLILAAMLLTRLPLHLWSREAPAASAEPNRPLDMLVAASLAGAAPFLGFGARVLLLRGATAMYWPLALAIGLSLLLWLPGSLRLGRSLGAPEGWRLAGVLIVLGINALLGLDPQPLLQLAAP
jgi:hypothetical protein